MQQPRVPFLSLNAWEHLSALLDNRCWWYLRATSRGLRAFFSVDRFFGRVKLPVDDKWPRERLFKDFAWLFALPAFADDLSHVPFFRERGAMARLVQGALRGLSFERRSEGDFLVATIQPSQQWNDTHLVSFLCEREGLLFAGCRCRNGSARISTLSVKLTSITGRLLGASTTFWR